MNPISYPLLFIAFLPKSISWSSIIPWGFLGAAAIVFLAWTVRRQTKASSAALDKTHENEIKEDVVNCFCAESENTERIRDELSTALSSGGNSTGAGLADLARIECIYEKQPNGKVRRELAVFRSGPDGKYTVSKIARQYDWEYIPDAIRAKMIRERTDKASVLVFQKK